ncbi:hypothetical protein ILYODFUR_007255 [Ilyodon furcidens]|uniref:Uncharacterized protein n=1 Tax=Ilyodon furcidens TaxID=33524 RepID=A0ABV0SMJ0_9TELE
MFLLFDGKFGLVYEEQKGVQELWSKEMFICYGAIIETAPSTDSFLIFRNSKVISLHCHPATKESSVTSRGFYFNAKGECQRVSGTLSWSEVLDRMKGSTGQYQ